MSPAFLLCIARVRTRYALRTSILPLISFFGAAGVHRRASARGAATDAARGAGARGSTRVWMRVIWCRDFERVSAARKNGEEPFVARRSVGARRIALLCFREMDAFAPHAAAIARAARNLSYRGDEARGCRASPRSPGRAL